MHISFRIICSRQKWVLSLYRHWLKKHRFVSQHLPTRNQALTFSSIGQHLKLLSRLLTTILSHASWKIFSQLNILHHTLVDDSETNSSRSRFLRRLRSGLTRSLPYLKDEFGDYRSDLRTGLQQQQQQQYTLAG